MSPLLKTRVSSAWVTTNTVGAVRLGGSTIPFGPSGNPDPGPQAIFGAEVPTNIGEDGLALAQGVRFTTSHAGNVTAGRWYFGASPPTSAKCGIYRVSDMALLGSATFAGSPVGLAWNTQAYVTPIPLAVGVQYLAAWWTSNRYPYSASYPWPHVSNDLTATGAYFSVAADLAFASTPTSLNFFCDLVFSRS